MSKTSEKSLADKLFPSLTEEELTDSILSIPPEQRRLHTETYDFSISTIVEYLQKGNLSIPEFQRRYVWNQIQGSRLIESLIIQCPIPVIYLNQEKDETLSVIDGNQRVQTLQKYVNNHFSLKGLTAYPELEGLFFHELDTRFQRHILNRTLRCIVIKKDTHPQVKFDVFERLNSGAVKLTPQELRHGIYHGKFMKLANKLAKDKNWRDLLSIETDKRMKSEELVIRFLAFHYSESYSKPLSSFLNNFSDSMRNLSDEEEDRFTNLFQKTVTGVPEIYGNLAFKVFTEDLVVISPFNAALFDAEMLSVSRVNIDQIHFSKTKQNRLFSSLAQVFSNEDFLRTITRATSDESQVRKRVQIISEILQKHL